MSQTKEGAQKAKATMIAKHGADHWSKIGAIGGTRSTTGGFYYAKKNYTADDPRHPASAGLKGGHLSKRGKKVTA